MRVSATRWLVAAQWLIVAATAVLPLAAHAAGRLPAGLQGQWRGEFSVQGEPLPFNFEITAGDLDQARLVLLNAPRKEAFRIEHRGGAEYVVPFRNHDTELQLALQPDGRLQGRYHHLIAGREVGDLAFTATRGQDWRFVPASRADVGIDVNGKWRFTTVAADGKSRERVAVLKQQGNHVTGVLLSPTGDSRALEGNFVGHTLLLSGFTGPAPSLYRGTWSPDARDEISGQVLTARATQTFQARRDDSVTLPDPYALTRATTDGPVSLAFPDATGKTVSLQDPRFRGKVVAVQILGTWCPNCVDETRFLVPWIRDNRKRGVEAVGIAFEQEDDAALAARTLPRYQSFYGIDYPILFGGGLDKASAGQRLPWLNEVVAYPTLVLLDRQGRVREIYTGFSSPETGEPYERFVQRFNATVDALLAEPAPKG